MSGIHGDSNPSLLHVSPILYRKFEGSFTTELVTNFTTVLVVTTVDFGTSEIVVCELTVGVVRSRQLQALGRSTQSKLFKPLGAVEHVGEEDNDAVELDVDLCVVLGEFDVEDFVDIDDCVNTEAFDELEVLVFDELEVEVFTEVDLCVVLDGFDEVELSLVLDKVDVEVFTDVDLTVVLEVESLVDIGLLTIPDAEDFKDVELVFVLDLFVLVDFLARFWRAVGHDVPVAVLRQYQQQINFPSENSRHYLRLSMRDRRPRRNCEGY